MAMQKTETLGVLMRDIRVRAINVSPTGILVESDRPMAVGAPGRLCLRIDDDEFVEDVNVVRCQFIEGAGVYHIAMRLMFTPSRDPRSICRAIA
jgi:hypothetical protein